MCGRERGSVVEVAVLDFARYGFVGGSCEGKLECQRRSPSIGVFGGTL